MTETVGKKKRQKPDFLSLGSTWSIQQLLRFLDRRKIGPFSHYQTRKKILHGKKKRNGKTDSSIFKFVKIKFFSKNHFSTFEQAFKGESDG